MNYPLTWAGLLLAYLSAMTLATSYLNVTHQLERLSAEVTHLENL